MSPTATVPVYPMSGSLSEKLRFLLYYAIHAPSPANSQPWRFAVDDRGVDVYVDRSRVLHVADSSERAAIVSAGTVIGHLEVAMRAYHMTLKVRYVADPARPNLLARVESAGEHRTTTEDLSLFSQIVRRHSAAKFRLDLEVPSVILSSMAQAAEDRRCGLRWIDRGPMQSSFGFLIQEADEALFSGRRFREEFAEWIRTRSEDAADGVPVEAFGIARVLQPMLPWLIEHLDVSRIASKEALVRATTAPSLGVLFTYEDARADWLDAGRALSDVLLRATQAGYQASIFEEAINSERFRARLCALLGTNSAPQVIVRFGVASDPTPVTTARRPVNDFLEPNPTVA